MNIVVLAGGNSTERAVSIVSGKGVCTALRERNHRAILLDAYFGREKLRKISSPQNMMWKKKLHGWREKAGTWKQP